MPSFEVFKMQLQNAHLQDYVGPCLCLSHTTALSDHVTGHLCQEWCLMAHSISDMRFGHPI